jgi:predicted ATPase/class 3 adenylate cyclase
MQCTSCGFDLFDGVKFCTRCGASCSSRCSSCGHANVSGSKFCGQCGAQLEIGAQSSLSDPRSAESNEAPLIGAGSVGERRHLTVMFYDLVNSTTLAARYDPEDVREALRTFHETIRADISRFGGMVAQYVGDGAVVFFGYPQAHEDDADRAIRSGLAAVAAVSKLVLLGSHAPKMRIGIATGLVVVSDVIGSGIRPSQDVTGGTPNLAARLQNIAEPNAIVIADSTRRLVGDLFECRDLGAVELKGFPEPIKAWRVLRESQIASRFEAMHLPNLTPMVGREVELALLLSRWQQASSGDGRVLLLSGEPGIGKSRMLRALEVKLQNEPHTLLRLFCSQHHQESALYPVISALERAAGFGAEETPTSRLTKLEELLSHTKLDPEDRALIADLLSIPTEGLHLVSKLNPQARKVRTLEALLAQFAALAGTQSLLVVFEDVHWIDPTSKELLGLLVERVASMPILLVVTHRPGFVYSTWAARSHVMSLSLDRLGRAQAAAMVEGVTGGKKLPHEVLDQILERTDGIPLFVEEVTKAVLESGLLREEIHSYSLSGSLPPFAVPATLQDSLMARLDRLVAAKEVAQIAAVIGREFSWALLERLSALGEPDLHTALHQLVLSELVTVRGVPLKTTYTFKHALVHDAAYQSLLKSKRQQIHLRTAQALEEHFPEIAKRQPEVLAHHYFHAQRDKEAADWLLLAGDIASQRYAHSEARRQFERALDALTRLSDNVENQRRRIDATIKHIGVSFAASNPGEHLSRLLQAEDIAQKLFLSTEVTPEDNLRLAQVQFWLGRTYHYLNQMPEALRYYDRVLRTAEEVNNDELLSLAAVMIGRALAVQGRFAKAAIFLDRALPILEEKQIWAEFIWGLGFKGLTLAARGHYAAGLSQAKRAQKIAIDINYSTGIAASHILLWGVYLQAGDAQRMLEESRIIVQVSEKAGDEMYVYLGYGMLAWAEALAGDLDGALLHMASSQRICKNLGGRAVLADWFHALNAEILLRAERPREAIYAAEEAISVARSAEGIFAEGLSHRTWAAALMRLSSTDWDDAKTHLEVSLRAFEEGEAHVEAARTHLVWGLCCQSKADLDALTHLRAAAVQFAKSELYTDLNLTESTIEQLSLQSR